MQQRVIIGQANVLGIPASNAPAGLCAEASSALAGRVVTGVTSVSLLTADNDEVVQ